MTAREPATLAEHFLPVIEISEEARKEKSGRPPTFEMHYWWTRKPLIAARAAILGALLPKDFDEMKFKKLLGLHRRKRAFQYDSNLDRLRMYYKKMWGTARPKILDPFAGGGSIPFEAMRLGADVYCADYNPVAYIILKTVLEYPQKYGKKLIKDTEFWTDWVFEKTKAELKQLYPDHNGKKVAAYVYAWVVTCPYCSLKIPLVTNWWLVKKGKKKQKYLNPVVKDKTVTFTLESDGSPPKGTASRGKGRCLACGKTVSNKDILKEITEKGEEKMLAVVLLGRNGKEYELPAESDINALEKAKILLKERFTELKDVGLIPGGRPDPGEVTSARYLPTWQDHFNARQLLLLTTLLKNIRCALQSIQKDPEYVSAVGAVLYHIVGKHIDYNCRTTRWHTGYEKIGDVMSFRRPSLTWDHAEVNPFVKSSGTLLSAKRGVLTGLTFAVNKLSRAQPPTVLRTSVLSLLYEKEFDIIVTDPPYYDDVQYGELSDFFYVWATKILNQYEPEFNLTETPKSEEIDVSTSRHGSKEASKTFFESVLRKAFKKIRYSLKDNGLLVLFFAHNSPDAWDFVVNTLQKTGFWITSTWPVHTELVTNPLARGKGSITSSIIITARKRFEEKVGYIEEVQEEVEKYVKKRVGEFWDSDMRGANLVVAAMGSALEKITQYSDIKSYSGNLKVKDILMLVQQFAAEHILSTFVKGVTPMDGPTSFYLYCRFNNTDQMLYDSANLIAKSLHIDLKVLEKIGLIESLQVKGAKIISVNPFDKRTKIEERYAIDGAHNALKAYARGGMHECESSMNKSKFARSDLLQVFKALATGIPKTDAEKTAAISILEGKTFAKESKFGEVTLDDFY